MNGKVLRLKRLIAPQDGRLLIFPLDHGVSCGPIPGLQHMEETVRIGAAGGADALVLHKGMLRYLQTLRQPLPGIFLHLSASTQLGSTLHHKVPVATVEEALRHGVDGVSVHINLGNDQEGDMLRDLGMVGTACTAWQLPLLVMIYVRGIRVPSPIPDTAIAHAARVAAELGADIIKIPAPAEGRVLAEITAASPVPVVVAGGSRMEDTGSLLRHVEAVLEAGASGVAIGRNIFQHQQPERLLQALSAMVHQGWSARRAVDHMNAAQPLTRPIDNEASQHE
ncbi:MAG TPA: fructose-bisphosphate aldolase [Syntrophobacteraceae bacterium]|nr:fructose-bisphosphate aldolase [Syntrophobacteraceae bacterium]HBZ53849.1 fructose-bisphosphate aldolase [Syntrophobacteraceae bacterium]